jgi:hypothetical protein
MPTSSATPIPFSSLSKINTKRAGYKAQDLKHAIFSEPHFVTAAAIQDMLEKCGRTCTYCRRALLGDYKARDPAQWTLDRVDNRLGHNGDNVVISCLGCNLQRRSKPHRGFLFTKQLVVVKLS